jgi:hypothetical protein
LLKVEISSAIFKRKERGEEREGGMNGWECGRVERF